MKSTSLLLLILIGLSFENPVFALTLQDQISAYSKGNYSQVIAIGHQLAKENPGASDCHYYAANSYSRLGQIEKAKREYAVCLNLTDNPQLRDYCNQALLSFSKLQSTNQSHASNMPAISHNLPEINNAPTSNLSAIDKIQSIGKARIAEINDWADKSIESIPKFYYYDQYDAKGHRIEVREPNPEYEYTVQQIREKQQAQTETMRLLMQNSKEELRSLSSPKIAQCNIITPGDTKPALDQKQNYTDSLLNTSPLPPPPFPASAKKGAEQALNRKIN